MYKIEDIKDRILEGDCLEELKKFPDDSVDLIFADPPYNIKKKFGSNGDNMDKREYIEWCKKWIGECMRILKPTGTFYFMAATQNMPYLDIHVSENYHVVSRIVWYYDSSGVQAKKYFGSLWEPILMVVKDKSKYRFNAKNVMVTTTTGAKRKLIDYRKTPPQIYNNKKVMGNVWSISRVRFRMNEYENHPTQKPEKLMEVIIKASSKKGDVVLDPFAGSFTTCAVAKRLNRKFIGIENIEEYYKIGLRRLGLATEYKGEQLIKKKERKTKNKSKQDHIKNLEEY